ncbi:uncharacterized protein LOC120328398 [Styela clava]
MAEKMANSIGRELRYFEYKLRKKQQTSKKKKNKHDGGPGGQLAWSDAPTSEDFKFTPKSEELQKAMPGSKGEEELQIQVALAMSREEEQERARRSESDKVRLEMALKESVVDSKPKPQPSLLDMSLSAPKPAASSNLGAGNPFGGASNDPWGVAPVPVAAATAPTFDPFAPEPTAEPIYAVSAKSASAQNDAWGIPQTTAAPPPQDPWGGTQTAFTPQPTFTPQPAFTPQSAPTTTFSTPPATDAWGTPIPATSLFDSQPSTQNTFQTSPNPFPAQNAFPTTQDAFSPSSTTQNAFSTQNGAWGNPDPFLGNQPAKIDPFAELSAQKSIQTQPDAFTMTSSASTFTAPPFDPLKEFDSLHIGTGNIEPAPVILQHDYGNGNSVSQDLFPLGGVLEPVSITPTQQNGFTATPLSVTAPPKKETDVFLGANSSLVNLDSGWKTYQVPYCTKPLGTVTQNPFQQTGPTRSLNEMKLNQGF